MSDTPQLLKGAAEPLHTQLAQHWAERIRQRVALPGARLPSVRRAAAQHGINPGTVVAAYDQLVAWGCVEARAQRGFYVREPAPSRARVAAPPPPSHPPASATALMRGMFEARHRRAPGQGTLPPDWLDSEVLRTALRRVLREGSDELLRHYGEPAGDALLRERLAERLAGHGIRVTPAQILTTTGATHALDLVTRCLLRPGDAVLVDDPGWSIEYARLTQAGMRLLPVPRGVDGPDLAVMQRLAEAHAPRAYVTVSVLHNPTGACLTAAAAHQVLQLAARHDFFVVEDDCYAAFAPAHAPRMSSLDGLARTIHVGSFSKVLTPAWRVGWLAAAPAVVAQLTEHKLLSTLTTSPLTERLLAHCLAERALARHIERVGERLAAARERTVRLAEDAGARLLAPPQGLFGWVDIGRDSDAFALAAHDAGWLTAPGTLFSPTRRAGSLMRINFATAQDAAFWRLLTD